ncbi:MAG TPA: hypothetical protein DCR04_06320 [Flavobacteriales bacterium]|nr:hypothetical protein [Flavobacteriales bacterium]
MFLVYFANVSEMDDYFGRPSLDPEDFYYSEEGYIVFTEKYLLKRGYCCKNSCKHCPYGFNKKSGRIEKK